MGFKVGIARPKAFFSVFKIPFFFQQLDSLSFPARASAKHEKKKGTIFYFPHPHPFAFAVNKSSAVFIFILALDDLERENRGSVNRLR